MFCAESYVRCACGSGGRGRDRHRRHQSGGEGKRRQLFINTTGIGLVPEGVNLSANHARPGDISSAERNDRRPRHRHSGAARRTGIRVTHSRATARRCTPWSPTCWRHPRDPLHARSHARRSVQRAERNCRYQSQLASNSIEREIPVREEVRGACEMLGLDPLYVANEGKLIAIVRAGSGR